MGILFLDIIKIAMQSVKTAIQMKASFEERSAAKYQIDILRHDAKQSLQDAADERQSGLEESRRKRLQSILNMEKEKANIAAGNIALSSSTARNIISDEKEKGELDALLTINSSEKSAQNYTRQSKKYYQNASLLSAKSKNKLFNSLVTSFANHEQYAAGTIGNIWGSQGG